jgi:uncharacterized membrane protein YgdD (TMEM256/DUF423 family)
MEDPFLPMRLRQLPPTLQVLRKSFPLFRSQALAVVRALSYLFRVRERMSGLASGLILFSGSLVNKTPKTEM